MGPHLVRHLIADGHHCRYLVREEQKGKPLPELGAEIVHGDITQPETLKGIGTDIDRLLHLATLGHASNFTVTPEMFQQVNVEGTLNIMH